MPESCLKTESFIDPAKSAAQIIFEHENFIRWVINSQNIPNVSEDDLFQDFFVQLISFPVPQDVRNVKSYLYKAIMNHLSDSCRRIRKYEKAIRKFRNDNDIEGNKSDPAKTLLFRDEVNKVMEFIKEISPGQKYMAITLRYRDGYSIQEVAEKMGIKYTSVTRYISHGLGRVRKCLNNT